MGHALMKGDKRLGQTPSQTVGPYFAYGLSPEQYGYAWPSIAGAVMADDSVPGERITLEGQVFDGAGNVITDALIEAFQLDAMGQRDGNKIFQGFGRCGTGTHADGFYRFETVKPGARAGEAPHIELIVQMRGLLMHLFTRAYFEDEPANPTDPVLLQVPPERRATLVARRVRAGLYRFDIHMQGEAETVFLDR
jgi:protocatechuate 3,4-dioxygenase alpha subunit